MDNYDKFSEIIANNVLDMIQHRFAPEAKDMIRAELAVCLRKLPLINFIQAEAIAHLVIAGYNLGEYVLYSLPEKKNVGKRKRRQ